MVIVILLVVNMLLLLVTTRRQLLSILPVATLIIRYYHITTFSQLIICSLLSLLIIVPVLFFQLAILASYSGNEVVAVYRYFRSLAADTPFTTARDNLIILFEKVLALSSLTHAQSIVLIIMLSHFGLIPSVEDCIV